MEPGTDDPRETLDDLVPEDVLSHVAGALSDFPSLSLPYEAVVYEGGEIDRDELGKTVAARIKSESIYGSASVERDVEGDEDDPDSITIRVLDPSEVVVDDEGNVQEVGRGEQ